MILDIDGTGVSAKFRGESLKVARYCARRRRGSMELSNVRGAGAVLPRGATLVGDVMQVPPCDVTSPGNLGILVLLVDGDARGDSPTSSSALPTSPEKAKKAVNLAPTHGVRTDPVPTSARNSLDVSDPNDSLKDYGKLSYEDREEGGCVALIGAKPGSCCVNLGPFGTLVVAML